VRAATSGGTDGTAAGGGISVGDALGLGVGREAFGGGVTVVIVSRGSDGAGGTLSRGEGMLRDGATTVAEVEVLSPPLIMTTVAITASTKTIPAIAATGRQRSSLGANSSRSA
jgi:hypothetical protein